jgi:hypothetical protein
LAGSRGLAESVGRRVVAADRGEVDVQVRVVGVGFVGELVGGVFAEAADVLGQVRRDLRQVLRVDLLSFVLQLPDDRGGVQRVVEDACVRCPMLWPDPAQRDRLVEIRDNLLARIAEAEREKRLGEMEGLQVSLAGAEEKLTQLDRRPSRVVVDLGVPVITASSVPRQHRQGGCKFRGRAAGWGVTGWGA